MNGPGTRIHDGPILKQELPSSSNYLKSVLYQLRQEWNNLPPHIRLMNDYDHFIVALKDTIGTVISALKVYLYE